MQTDITQIKNRALPILKEAGVIRSSVFGSYVRGENSADSDIDVLVELPRGSSLLDLIRLQRKLEQALGIKVDLLTYNSISPLLRDTIQQEQMQIL